MVTLCSLHRGQGQVGVAIASRGRRLPRPRGVRDEISSRGGLSAGLLLQAINNMSLVGAPPHGNDAACDGDDERLVALESSGPGGPLEEPPHLS
ncbi:hypothetical protein EYF80_058063 [Liparis tanakae]|uniref:Uncharacterized protein n=1 Tax=Liparis tanakae TaxID=230148 RepID=A0A4Z2ESJ8_9TELE|nr:hypothetical protein EYF80_058063 [Liparis tanakae]